MRMKGLIFILAAAIIGSNSSQLFSDIPEPIKTALDFMQQKNYMKAIETLVKNVPKEYEDYSLWLKALAHFKNGTKNEALKLCNSFIAAYPDSKWINKIRFLAVDILVSNKDYKSASASSEAEAQRLLSHERKETLAQVYISYAESLSYKPSPEELDMPKPDYNKAYQCYVEVQNLEIGDELKEKATFMMARMKHLANDMGGAQSAYINYLSQFDPDWGSSQKTGNSVPTSGPGKHILEARLDLAEVYLRSSSLVYARMTLEDLVKLIDKNTNIQNNAEKIHRFALRLLPSTYSFPSPNTDFDLESGIKASDRFLALYPGDPGSVGIAWNKAQALIFRGRTEEGISNLLSFINKKGFSVNTKESPEEKTFREDFGNSLNPAEQFDAYQKEAVFTIGTLNFAMGKFGEAISYYSDYITKFPNGPHWTKAQAGIIDAQYRIGVELISQKKYKDAEIAWNDFLTRYPLDQRSRKIIFTIARISYEEAKKAKAESKPKDAKENFEKALAGFLRLVSKYPNTDESSLALLTAGEIQENELGDLEAALGSYRKLTWGPYAGEAASRMEKMVNKELLVRTERIFRTNEQATIKINARNIEKLKLSAYKLDLEAYFRKTHSILGIERLDLALIAPDKNWEAPVTGYKRYLPIDINLPVPMDGPGVYAINVSSDDLEATTLVIRSDIDIIVTSSKKEALVFVENVTTQNTVANAKVLLTDGSRVLAEGTTGSNGVFLKNMPELAATANVDVFVSLNGNIAATGLSIAGLNLSAGLSPKGYIYTDLPAYKPGQEVNIRGIIRDIENGSYTVPHTEKDSVYLLSVSDPQGRTINTESITLGEYGTFLATVALSGKSAIGTYAISVSNKDNSRNFSGSFIVEHYKLEKITLTCTFDKPVYFRGESVSATFHAGYYFGQPVSNATLRYTTPDGLSFTDSTDSKGDFTVKIDSTPFKPGSFLTLKGTLVSENVSVSAIAPVAAQEFYILLSSARDVILTGESVEINTITIDANDVKVSKDVEITMYERLSPQTDPLLASIPWLETESTKVATWAEKIVETKKITTDKLGTGRTSFSPKKGGQYIFRARSTDRLGNTITAESYVFVSGDDDATLLRLFAGRNHYAVGETDSIVLYSRFKLAPLALVTFEGEGIISYSVVTLKAKENKIPLSIGHEHFPNFTVSVAAMDGNKLHTATVPFTVERELKVGIKTDKEIYGPSETAKIDITVTDNLGKPVIAELSLSLINEALLNLYQDPAPDIVSFFQEGAYREAKFVIDSSCTFSYNGITKPVLKDVLLEEDRVAHETEKEAVQNAGSYAEPKKKMKGAEGQADEFATAEDFEANAPSEALKEEKSVLKDDIGGTTGRTDAESARKEIDTASVWLGSVVTDKNGKASASIIVPESFSAYRIRMKGATKETLVGQSETSLVVRKEFFVNIKSPGSLQEKDEVRFIGKVTNMGEYKGKITASLEITTNGKTSGLEPVVANISPSETIEVIFPAFIVPSVKALDISLKVKADNGSSDKVADVIPVRPWGLPYEVKKSGVGSGSQTVFVKLPQDKTYESRWMDITLYPAIEDAILDLVGENTGVKDSLYEYVAPFAPEPGARLVAVVSMLEYLKDRPLSSQSYSSLMKKARVLLGELISSQDQEGGWSLADGTEKIAVSSEAYWGLTLAKKLGIVFDEKVLPLAKAYLTRSFSSIPQNDNESKAHILLALSQSGDADYSFVNRLYRIRNELGNASCAFTALALSMLDKNEMGKDILKVLDSRMKTIGLDSTTAAFWPGTDNLPWLRSDIETTALVILAYQAIDPGSPVIPKGISYILTGKGPYGFDPMKAVGSAARALTEYFGKTKTASSDFQVEISVNDKSVGKLVTVPNVKGQSKILTIEVPAEAIAGNENKVQFVHSGKGDFFYSISLNGFSKEPKDPLSWENPRFNYKKYIHEPLRYKGKPVGASTQEIKELEYGQTVDIHVELSYGYLNRYLILEEFVPSGTIVLKDTVRGNYSDMKILPGKMVFYFKPNDYISQLSYSLAPYLPGKYKVLPSVLRDAFDPSQMRLSEERELTVLASGEKTKEPYSKNNEELFGLGSAYFEDGKHKEALELLEQLYGKNPSAYQPQVAQKLLWIRTEDEFYNPGSIVEYFEILKEKYPDLSIPFAKILTVGRSYRDIGENERSYLVYKATIDASFLKDASIAGYLENSGEVTGSFDYMNKLLLEYPDSSQVISAAFSLAQEVYGKAPQAQAIVSRISKTKERSGQPKPSTAEFLESAKSMLGNFMSMYPENELADDAAFTTLNISLDQKKYDSTIFLSREFQKRYKKSTYFPTYQYIEALAQFSLRKYDDAIKVAQIVADGSNDNSNLATYILGQIYHSKREPAKALSYYKAVSGIFPDAGGAIDFFESRSIGIDEVSIFSPNEKIAVKLSYKNIKEAHYQVYRVDLMKLYLREKNLSRIAGVNLSGITPLIEKKVSLGNGADYMDKSLDIALDIKEEGAYLIVIRGDDLFASGLVLCTPLEIKIQEDIESGRMRINVFDKIRNIYPDAVHVKAIGSENPQFVSGDTDLRGIFIADNIRGVPTVIARDVKNRYAFYRGKNWLGAQTETKTYMNQEDQNKLDFDQQYRGNLNNEQRIMNEKNRSNLDNLYKQNVQGVQVQQAY